MTAERANLVVEVARTLEGHALVTDDEGWVPGFDLAWAGARCEEEGVPWQAGRAALAALTEDLLPVETVTVLWGRFPRWKLLD